MLNRIVASLLFLAGCAVGGVSGQFVVPKASAQQAATLTKWEYTCFKENVSVQVASKATQLGDQGWEMVAVDGTVGDTTWCFKRAKM